MSTLYSAEETLRQKARRNEIIAALINRDGTMCQFPGQAHELDFEASDGPTEVTIDHWTPQYYGKANDWTIDEIWNLSNLRLMCKKHNAQKGDRIPNDDGTLPEKPMSRFRFRRQKRAGRADLCPECDNGHNLFIGEICANCGCDAQRFPRWAKVRSGDCTHDITWCWACSIGVVGRTGAVEMIFLHGEGGDE